MKAEKKDQEKRPAVKQVVPKKKSSGDAKIDSLVSEAFKKGKYPQDTPNKKELLTKPSH